MDKFDKALEILDRTYPGFINDFAECIIRTKQFIQEDATPNNIENAIRHCFRDGTAKLIISTVR